MKTFTDETQFIQWNENMAHKYDPEAYHLRSHPIIRWIERRRVNAILEFIAAKPLDKVLEVGCGASNVLAQIPAQTLYGVDLSTYLLKKSQNRLQKRDARLLQTNAEKLPFCDQKFDKLICTEVLEHVTDPRQVIGEMARMAHKESTIVISVPNEAWINMVKNGIHSTGLSHWFLQQSGTDSYSSPDRMTDEWHLHEFDLPLLEGFSKDFLRIQQVRAIPFPFLPLRYVVQFELR
ncbi:class I SAM-dependent methyltransferase [Anaerolineales bacterium HSG25]|nr:class I SAM-dependent methyltransferase [Anaerolineales bacterium HSG25]